MNTAQPRLPLRECTFTQGLGNRLSQLSGLLELLHLDALDNHPGENDYRTSLLELAHGLTDDCIHCFNEIQQQGSNTTD